MMKKLHSLLSKGQKWFMVFHQKDELKALKENCSDKRSKHIKSNNFPLFEIIAFSWNILIPFDLFKQKNI